MTLEEDFEKYWKTAPKTEKILIEELIRRMKYLENRITELEIKTQCLK